MEENEGGGAGEDGSFFVILNNILGFWRGGRGEAGQVIMRLNSSFPLSAPFFVVFLYPCFSPSGILSFHNFISPKETTLERADFTLQLLMFVTAEKERVMFIIFCLSIFCQLLSPRF